MKLAFLILFCLIFQSSRGQMRGGEPARLGQFPFAVQLHKPRTTVNQGSTCHCGGSIISKHWVLTAAHCLRDEEGNDLNVFVVAGDVSTKRFVWTSEWYGRDGNRHQSRAGFNVDRTIVHPLYDIGSTDHDAALLFFKTSILSNEHIRPVELPNMKRDRIIPATGDECTLMGWGFTDAESRVNTNFFLNHAKQPVTNENDRFVMFYAYDSSLNLEMFHGDSGSPLVCEDSDGNVKLFGFAASRIGFGGTEYLRVDPFRSWIREKQSEVEREFGLMEGEKEEEKTTGFLERFWRFVGRKSEF